MKERPILFKEEMVWAILDGRKTQSRRVVKYIPDLGEPDMWCHKPDIVNGLCGDYRRYCPYGQPGDRLWVRESFWQHGAWRIPPWPEADYDDAKWHGTKKIKYCADLEIPPNADGDYTWRKFPSIHMPRWASRINLRVTGVRVERVQDISDADASAEGVPVDANAGCPDRQLPKHWCPKCNGQGVYGDVGDNLGVVEVDFLECDTNVKLFRNLWDSIYKKRGFGWDANPWVWVIEFELEG